MLCQKPLKIGILGGSNYAAEMLDLMHLRINGLEVTALCCLEKTEPAAQLAAQLRIQTFQSSTSFFQHAKSHCDIIYNALPPHLHASYSIEALSLRIPVWLEKPPVTTLEDYNILLHAIRHNQLPVFTCFNNLYNPTLNALKQELLSGKFGRIREIHTIGGFCRKPAYFKRSSWAGKVSINDDTIIRDGSFSNALSHAVVNALFLAGSNIESLDSFELLSCHRIRSLSSESEDTAIFEGLGSKGCRFTFNLSLVLEDAIPPCNRIVTDKAVFLFQNYEQVLLEHIGGNSCRYTIPTVARDVRIDMLEELRDKTFAISYPSEDFERILPFVSLIEQIYAADTVTVDYSKIRSKEWTLRLRTHLLQNYDTGIASPMENAMTTV